MSLISHIKQIKPYLFEIPVSAQAGMRVPARVYATQKMMDAIKLDRSLQQLVNSSMLPGVVRHVVAMPDIHEGYGLPIGGVAATQLPDGAISPGAVGYDIDCGVRLLLSSVTASSMHHKLDQLADGLMHTVPSGTGRGGEITVMGDRMDRVLAMGARWCVAQGWGTTEDLDHIEDNGEIEGADPSCVSERAKKRGRDQLGTLGSGNHFLEVQRVDRIYDRKTASAWGLFHDQIAVAVHCGSRGLGHQVCTDYVQLMVRKLPAYGYSLPDRELACAPASSDDGQRYKAAMAAAANFAFANRQIITHRIRDVWSTIFSPKESLSLLYDVSHNIAKEEGTLLVHRKGATRAFPGQPVLIPGTMGTSSFVLCGAQGAMEQTFGTVCHGAGRAMSRHEAKRKISASKLLEHLKEKGIIVRCHSERGLVEEAPAAYKDVESVVKVVEQAGLSRIIARLKPVAVIKGE